VPIRFRLHSLDVIHSFYVPAFFFKRDVIPGRTNEFEITIEEPGVYGGQCAEFCGLSHGRMFFTIRAVEQADYDAWVAEKSPAGAATAEAGAGETTEAEPTAPAEASETAEPDAAEPDAAEPDAAEPDPTPVVDPGATAGTSEEAA
jgi:cytochrome c oxidase subunit 2